MRSNWFRRQADADEWVITVNGVSINMDIAVIASVSECFVITQDFRNWRQGDPLPIEKEWYGRVEIEKKEEAAQKRLPFETVNTS
jgi:hypothetical protein